MTTVRKNIYELEINGTTMIRVTEVTGLDSIWNRPHEVRHHNDGSPYSVEGLEDLARFRMHDLDPAGLQTAVNWYRNREELTAALHRKDLNKNIIDSIEFEELKVETIGIDDMGNEEGDEGGHFVSFIGRPVSP